MKVWWIDAERWLTAHRINEIAVLCAQHLDERRIDKLKAHVCRRLGIALALIYGRPARAWTAAVTDLGAYLARKRDPPLLGDRQEPWPEVPRSHPLRFRYDCWRGLEPNEFARVERLLNDSLTTRGGWCRPFGALSLAELERAFRLIIAADDPEQAYIRRCGAELAVMGHQIPIPPTTPLALHPRATTAAQIKAIHGYTDAATAGYYLAKLITGLPDRLLAIIGRDQIADDAILECLVPEAARPILRAIEDKNHEPVLEVPYHASPEPSADTAGEDEDITREQPAPPEDEFATALDRCCAAASSESQPSGCRGRSARTSRRSERTASSTGATASTGPATSRSTAAFASTAPPIRALTNDWDDLLTTRRNLADI